MSAGLWLTWLLAPAVAGAWVRLWPSRLRHVLLAFGGIASLAAFDARSPRLVSLAAGAPGLYWLALLAPLAVGAWLAWKGPPRLAAAFLGLLGGLLLVAVAVRLGTTTCYFGPFREAAGLARIVERGLQRGTPAGPSRVDASGALVVEVLIDAHGEGLLERFRLLGPADAEGFRPGPLLWSAHEACPGGGVVEPARIMLPRAPDTEGYDLRLQLEEGWDVEARYRRWQDGRRYVAPVRVRKGHPRRR